MSKKLFGVSNCVNYINSVITYLREAHTWGDKITIIKYYLNTPFFFIDYLRGKKYNPFLPDGVTIKNKYGIFFCGKNKYSLAGFSSLNEPEVREKMRLKEGIAIDIGANGGMHTIPLAKMLGSSGEVIAIEPEPNNIIILKKNIKLNDLRNVTVINKACFSKTGKMKLYLDEFGGSGTHSLIKKQSKKINVETDTLDNILKNLKIKNVDLIKIDVEGAETDVLKGATKTLKKYHPKIIFEAWDEQYLKKVKKILDKFNYKIKQIVPENYLAY